MQHTIESAEIDKYAAAKSLVSRQGKVKPSVSTEARRQVLALRRGHSLRQVAECTGLPLGTVKTICHRSGALRNNAALRDLFILPPVQAKMLTKVHAHAREAYVAHRVDAMHDIAVQEPDVQRAKLRTDLIKWEAARILPKQWGERTALDVTTTNKLDAMTREELETQIKQLLRSGRMRLVPESQVIDAEAKQLEQCDD